MRIAVAFKAVPDSQDVQVAADRTLDFSKAKLAISEYDKNAIELGAQLADEAVAVTVGGSDIDNSKLKKDVLARGMARLCMAADDALAGLDAHATAAALADVIAKAGDVDMVLCGDGSADDYAQQVDVQLAEKLGWPVVTAAAKVEVSGSTAVIVRALEECKETVEVELPAVVSVTPDAAEPRIPGMKDILAAGKKPMEVSGADGSYERVLDTVECLAPEQAARKQEIVDAADDGAVEKLAAAIKAAL
ncbi:electron transfer flavoprotein [Gordonibacter sp. An230]|uniref:electron transfer flavoprotein n=1 Tax=Gordonibacter sp. An230 TaxID=1965592 RepID=UPI000B375447|nr:electron transfer flavoprotein [Gordonibacter sp. An230]OUO90284.1 electron transfer flavoprotein [Gordonibacter sp. An230]